MALRKLPCEYPELGIQRAKDCFGNLSDKQKQNLLDCFERAANNMEKLRWEDARR